jgi:ribosome-associated translation inhibitor RaiA
MERSDALEQAIRDRTEKLGKFHPAITSVHISVTQDQRHSAQGRQFIVRLDLHVKGRSFAITQQGDADAFVAARAAFDAAKRVLDTELDTARSFVKLF